MPHAVLKVNNLTGIVVSDFHLSAPTDLVDRVMSMISSAGLHPQAQAQEGSEVGHVKIEDFNQGVELHTLLNWIENSAWTLVHTSEAAISQSACNHTFIFQKATFMGR